MSYLVHELVDAGSETDVAAIRVADPAVAPGFARVELDPTRRAFVRR